LICHEIDFDDISASAASRLASMPLITPMAIRIIAAAEHDITGNGHTSP